MDALNSNWSLNDKSTIKLEKSLQNNINNFRDFFKNDQTVIFREFDNRYNLNLKFCAISLNGMTDKVVLDDHIIRPLMSVNFDSVNIGQNITAENILDILMKKAVVTVDIKRVSDIPQMVDDMLYGDTIILIDGLQEAIIADTKGWAMRAIEEPLSERTVKGPREGFNESIMTNISLVRRKIRNCDLKFEFDEIGTRTKTRICISYIKGLANEKIISELKKRLKKIDVDGVIYSQTIEEFIKDAPLSLFRTIGSSERPDVIAGGLLEGRIAVFCDGTPFVITLPFLFVEYFQSVDDYSTNYMFASFNRLVRYFSFFLGLSVPALYTAVTTFHQELIPTPLLLSIANARQGVPFPTVVEAVAMLIGFDLLREAGVRLPQPIGQAVSIVGALVIGDAAVNARLISAPMVVIAAMTVIASFLLPKLLGPFIIVRIILLALAGFLGLYGYMFGIIGLFIYPMSLRSFGVPYTLGVGLISPEELKDTAVRVPWGYMKYRPKLIAVDSRRNRTKK